MDDTDPKPREADDDPGAADVTDGTESETDDEPGSTDLADGNEFETDDGQEWQDADWHDAEPALDAADRKADDDWIASSAEPESALRGRVSSP